MPKGNGNMDARAVILAGGKGSRLGPYTTVLPKPLLPIGDRAILDVVVRQLCECGFTRITLAVGYLSHLVRAVMGDGSRYGITIDYHEEEEPLGTVGALATIGDVSDPFLVMNGDVLTALDYHLLMDAHRASGNALTIASHPRIVQTDYGVMHVGEQLGATGRVVGFEEKPEIPFVVSMGVYILEPRTLDFIQPGERLDLPDLVLRLLEAGEQVGSYLFEGFWLDIGRHEDYEKAIREFDQVRHELLGEHVYDPVEVSPK
jgi:NDP-sugar pyrophosphorylase family protein